MQPSQNKGTRLLRQFGGKVLDFAIWMTLPFTKTSAQIIYEYGTVNPLAKNLVICHVYAIDAIEWENAIFLLKGFDPNTWQVIMVCNYLNSKYEISEDFITLHRKNIGFDLAGYRDALKFVQRTGMLVDNILLINDSMIWSRQGLLDITYKALETIRENVIVGLTDSHQRFHHLQTYFLCFQGKNNRAIDAFSIIPNSKIKRALVTFGEIRLSKQFLKNGLQLKAVFDYEFLVHNSLKLGNPCQLEPGVLKLLQKNINLNPTQHLWKTLRIVGHPGIKKSLINFNPAKLKELPVI